jgi:hypothetical protein
MKNKCFILRLMPMAFLAMLGLTSRVFSQNVIVRSLAGGTGPLDGTGSSALFSSPWQLQQKDSLVFITDKDNDALRYMNMLTKRVKTILSDQKDVSGLAISSTGDSLFFCTNSNVLKLFIRSSQQLSILDTLPDTDIDAIACRRNGHLIIGSAFGHRLAEWSGNGQLINLAGKLNTPGNVDGIDSIARFNRISSVVLSQTEDTMFISDRFNSKIRRFIRSSKQVGSINTGTHVFGPRQLVLNSRKDTLFIGNSARHTLVSVPLRSGSAFVLCGSAGAEGYVDGSATATRFSFPLGLARGDSGFIICDNGNRRLRIFRNGRTRTIAGAGFIGDGTGLESRFNVPYDLAKHPFKDTLYITDQNNHAIRMVDLKTRKVSTLVGDGTSGNVSGNTPALVRLNRPSNLALSPSGDTLFFVEPFANKIKYLLTKTNQVRWLAGSDTAGYRDNSLGKYAFFNRPQDLAYRDGFLYIADALNHKIRKIRISTTAVSTFAGSSAGFKDSTLLGAKFNRPATLEWVDDELWVGEDAGLKIRRIKPLEDTVLRWVGSGNIGLVDGPGNIARFMGIFKISFDPFRNGFLVAGYQNEGVCRFVSRDTALVSTYFNSAGFQDGPLNQAKFLGPMGYFADLPNQRLYFTDAGNNRIRIMQYFINRAPSCSFDTASVNNLLEDQGIITLPAVATNISAGSGPADSLQTVEIQVETVPPGKAINAGLNPSGTLSFQPAPDYNGVFLLKIRLKDNGGTEDGGVDTSFYFKQVSVKAVNDAPRFQVAGNDTASNAVSRSRPGFLLELSPGPEDEIGQNLDTIITCSRPDWFAVLPWFEGDTLRFEPLADTLGTCEIFVKLRDNGGTEDGGVDSTNSGFTITLLDPSSVNRRLIKPSLRIFPNPASESFRISNLPTGCRQIEMYDLKGQLLESLRQSPDGLFRLSRTYSGNYVLRAKGNAGFAGMIRLEKP